jgi:hypothetical protein
MSEDYIVPFGTRETYIVELSSNSLSLLGQLLHMHNISNPDNTLGRITLDDLNKQTNCVYLKPQMHNVFPDPLEASAKSIKSGSVYHIPFDI